MTLRIKLPQHRRKPFLFFAVPLCFFSLVGMVWFHSGDPQEFFTRKKLSQTLGKALSLNQFPSEFDFGTSEEPLYGLVNYTVEENVQHYMKRLMEQYRPDYGSFVAIDATTGRVLTMVNFQKHDKLPENLALRATFPAASVFKVVTATAAIDQRKVTSETVIPFNGKSHTLYKSNVKTTKQNRWTRYMTLREAFGRSVNTIFGKLGAFYVGGPDLDTYAKRFGFNEGIPSDLPIQHGQAEIPDEGWGVVEAASGFTRKNTMSPVQGALIAAAVANDGVMMSPYVVDSIYSPEGMMIYQPKPKVASVTMDALTASELRTMMEETVRRGTSRGSFRSFFRKKAYRDITVGGKTGSLTGYDPFGKCDWFVGYAYFGKMKIAMAALTVHEKYWTVRSAYLARRFVEKIHELAQSGALTHPNLVAKHDSR